jgi:WD40 repeat protein
VTKTPSPTPTPESSSPPAAPVHTVRLSADTENHSGEPGIAYLFDGRIVRPDGSTVQTAVSLDEVAALGDGWVGRGTDEQGRTTVYRLDANGRVAESVPSSGDLAAAPDGTLVSYATRDGRLMVLWDGPTSPAQLRTEGPGQIAPVEVQGSGACDNPEGVGGCMVYYNQQVRDGSATAKSSSRHGIVQELRPFQLVADVSVDGLVAGRLSTSDTGSCSGVQSESGRMLWQTCSYTLDRFSPDGRYVLAGPAYRDGLGDSVIAVLDARTGTVVTEFRTGRNSFVSTSAWDTDGTVLTMLYDHGWALMRLTPDGGVTSVSTGRIAGSPESAPIRFAARP